MSDIGILLILGIGVFGGILGAALFQKMRFPQVVGYITIGIIIGQSGFKLISSSNIDNFSSINDFALGVIGFLVGAELKISTFKQYGKQFSSILLSETILCFVFVSLASTFALNLTLQNWNYSIASGVVLGAIASATDPASTVSILWQYRAKGALSTAIIAIVALDDAVAMLLYGFGAALAKVLVNDETGFAGEAVTILASVGGALIIGALFAYILNSLIQRMQSEKRIVLTMGVLLLTIGITKRFNLDVILGTMVLGFILVNKSPRRIEDVLNVFKTLASPVYVIFGILVGARLDLLKMPLWLWGIVFTYILFRCLGKVLGTHLGAKLTKVDDNIKNHLGYCLFTQGGIAAGLAIVASQHINHIIIDDQLRLGDIIVFVVTASTLIVQFMGQALLKRALFKTGENDKNVTEEDVINEWKVKNVVQETKAINEALPLTAVMARFQNENFLSLPVVNKENRIVGIISLDNMKELLTDQDSWMWILTADVMEPVMDTFYLNTPLDEALGTLKTVNIEQAPILNSKEDSTLAGIMTLPYTNICISRELLKRQGEVVRS